MVSKLNELFAANGIDLTAKRTVAAGPNGIAFYGIRIDSGIKGLDSKIEMDTTSGAYKTIFTNRNYNSYGTQATITNEDTNNRTAYFKGSKDLSDISVVPLNVVAGQNDSFKLDIGDGSEYTITIPAGTYNSISQVVSAVNGQLSAPNALSGYDGKVEAVAEDDKLVIRGTGTTPITNIKVSALTGNSGFDAIFQGYSISYKEQVASGTGSITLNEKFDGTIPAGDNTLTIKVGDQSYDVGLPVGNNITQSQITDAINGGIPGHTDTLDNKFSDTSEIGTTTTYTYSPTTSSGTTSAPSWSGTAKGVTTFLQGTTAPDVNTPATLKVDIPSQFPKTIDSTTDTMYLTINSVTAVMKMAHKTYASIDEVQ